MKDKCIEVSFDYRNRDCFFVPMDRSVRGRFMLSRVAEPTAMSFRDRIPEDIPAQIVGIDVEKNMGYLLEPIHDNKALKTRLEKRGFSFEDERQEFPGIEVKPWLYWIRRTVDDGKAQLLKGELPQLDDIDYDPPSRLAPKPKRGPSRLREIFQSHPDVAAAYAGWTAERKQEWEQLVGV